MPVFLLLVSVLSGQIYTIEFVRCYDGDTCYFNVILKDSHEDLGMGVFSEQKIYLKDQRVRFCDINAPELRGDDAANAIKARDTLVSWIQAAKVLQLDVPQKKNCLIGEGDCDSKEKYGRWLGYVLADGVNLNVKMVTNKLAAPYILCR